VDLSLRCLLMALASVSCVVAQQPGNEPLSTAATFGTTVVIPGGLRGSVYLVPKDTTVLPDLITVK
jgi:hypothetical protein